MAQKIEYEAIDLAREEWVRKGRPNDPNDPYWAGVLAQRNEPRPAWVEPLLTLG